MKAFRNLFILAISLCSFSSFAQSNTFEGFWNGVADVAGMELRIEFDIVKDGENYSGSMGSPDQGMPLTPVDSVIVTGMNISILMTSIGLNFEGVLRKGENKIDGSIIQNTMEFPVVLQREKLESSISRPQTPKPPFNYFIRDITFENKKDGVTLAGTLTLPDSTGRHPIIVFITGSGPQNRDEEILSHKPFLVISDFLVKKGIGSLRFDDRGVGGSTGSHAKASSRDFANDVIAALDYLNSSPNAISGKKGLLGHSEGGMIAAMVAAERPDVSFVVSLAGTAVSGKRILELQTTAIMVGEGTPKQAAENNTRRFMGMVSIIQNQPDSILALEEIHQYMDSAWKADIPYIPDFESFKEGEIAKINNTWMRFFISYDPAEDWKRVVCPVLALNGSKDLQVEMHANFTAMEYALKSGPCKDYTLTVLPNHNHLFQKSSTGKVSEYGSIEQTISEETLSAIALFLKKFHHPD